MAENPAWLSNEMASATRGRNWNSSQRVMYWPSGALRLITPSRSRNAALLMEEFPFHQFGNNMTDKDMAFLNAGSVARRSTKTMIDIGGLFEFASRRASKCDGV